MRDAGQIVALGALTIANLALTLYLVEQRHEVEIPFWLVAGANTLVSLRLLVSSVRAAIERAAERRMAAPPPPSPWSTPPKSHGP